MLDNQPRTDGNQVVSLLDQKINQSGSFSSQPETIHPAGNEPALRLHNVLTVASYLKFKVWDTCAVKHTLDVTMTSGTRALIRPDPSSDYNVFYEVFVKRVYDPPAEVNRDSVRQVVDLGANVGFSNLFWLETFPNASVLTYEPHPLHVALTTENLKVNRSTGRVTIRSAAAGTSDGDAFLSDHGSESSLLESSNCPAVKVKIVDFFNDLASCGVNASEIDVLKIDIEGGEYILLRDSRFAEIHPKVVCMEAHPNEEMRLNEQQAVDFWMNYWTGLGYRSSVHKGIVWSIRL